ncbi:DtxR family iron (metal) dependent repressor [Isoptericola sp. CG 20/1183]|uniref:Manganese transport regulator n=1 Tax=Isoptericola halotolerans TaxID=300560 RepID=A0ABX5EFE0_9MICO|nr:MULTISPECIES: metal-dependent transcriptional regulator [Isoptericola]MCK0117735.1 metal-dependent transcriptional regulator [Isoptericola sp. S6320L]PRZ05096.1 DtxR family iron (metal) dependent repressor [Isoptericola halotolerans]PRZ05834.1 DtxR family iron (metal) dependent repressor [Isoptericola sp. CG 20/1183]
MTDTDTSQPADLTPVAQDYLKTIWSAQEWSDEKVTTGLLADRLGVGPSTVSETVRRLTAQGLLGHEPYGGVWLTDLGRRHALTMVRRHRLIETWLVRELGYTWDEVHDEAEVLEHAVSDRLVARIDARLGHPVRDPHGDPIPTADGRVVRPDAVLLGDLAAGQRGVVARISDADPEALRYLAGLGLELDVEVTVVRRRDYAGTLSVAWAGAEGPVSVDLGHLAASRIRVVPA